MDNQQLADLIRRSLQRSRRVEIEGLGVFERGHTGRVSLREANRLRIFIAYATEDIIVAKRLYQAPGSRGYAPWLDRRKLLSGQSWPHFRPIR